ncbi:hypothetical protein NEUTE2DRAFT_67140 [Neurospora tetrasperma FGSC 2509]|nr:hypothetical protein NEUTE2DRAFT_67140 [Neurospora tetrasperma FGSC 2509]
MFLGLSSVGVLFVLSFAGVSQEKMDVMGSWMKVERSCIVSYCNGFSGSGESPTGDEHSPSPQNDVIITKKNTASLKIRTLKSVPFSQLLCFKLFPERTGKVKSIGVQIRGNATDKKLGIQGGKRGLVSDWTLPGVTSQTGLFLLRNNWTGTAGWTDRWRKHQYIKANEIGLMEGEGGFASGFGRTRPLLGFEFKSSSSMPLNI